MAMLEVKDLHVYYGVIQALKGILSLIHIYLQLFSRPYFMRALNRCSSLSFSCACKKYAQIYKKKIIRKNKKTS